MEEIIFLFEESLVGVFTAKGLGVSIFSVGDTMDELSTDVVDAVHCHFVYVKIGIIRLLIVKEEIIAA